MAGSEPSGRSPGRGRSPRVGLGQSVTSAAAGSWSEPLGAVLWARQLAGGDRTAPDIGTATDGGSSACSGSSSDPPCLAPAPTERARLPPAPAPRAAAAAADADAAVDVGAVPAANVRPYVHNRPL